MKIQCACGYLIVDATDALPHKAHLISDEDWFRCLEGIAGLFEKLGKNQLTTDEAIHEAYRSFSQYTRLAYQCHACGRIYIDDPAKEHLRSFIKEDEQTENNVFSKYRH